MLMGTTDNDGIMCTLRFTDESEQAKAFNHLIYTKTSFSGVEKNTITVRKKDCLELKNKNIHYEEVL